MTDRIWIAQPDTAREFGRLIKELTPPHPNDKPLYEYVRADIAKQSHAAGYAQGVRDAAEKARRFGEGGHLKSRFTKPNGEIVKRMSATEAASQWIADCIVKEVLALLPADAPAQEVKHDL
jgi:hypothetical protein